jgi:hypothetical protein
LPFAYRRPGVLKHRFKFEVSLFAVFSALFLPPQLGLVRWFVGFVGWGASSLLGLFPCFESLVLLLLQMLLFS